MIEKVRSIAMISSSNYGGCGVAALISARSANGKRLRGCRENRGELRQFHTPEPFLKALSRFRSPGPA